MNSAVKNPYVMAGIIMEDDEEWFITRHNLLAGKGFSQETHKSNELIIFSPGNGRCVITIEGVEKNVELRDEVLVYFIEAGKKHSILAITPVSYVVIRDGFD